MSEMEKKDLPNQEIHTEPAEETAAEDACKIEHVISDETFHAVKKYMDGFDAQR